MKKNNIAISGITGKMGSYIYNYLKNNNSYNIVYGISRTHSNIDNLKLYKNLNSKVDILIDFTESNYSFELIKECLNNGIKVLSGTTNFTNEEVRYLRNLSIKTNTSLIIIPNYSIGATLVQKEIENLKRYYKSVDIIEVHSKTKIDKPSGTAKEYAYELDKKFSEVDSIRINDVVASHEIIFSNGVEKLILRHEINHRDAFLDGFNVALSLINKNNYINVIGLKEFNNYI